MLHIILADSEIELVPEELWNHPSVISTAQKRGKKPRNILLDSNFHHSAIREFFPGEENRRGRPDIVHYFLLNALESPLNIKNLLRVYVHTRNNETIFIRPDTRIPKSYNRFIGLMEDLFHNSYVPSRKEPLIWIESMNVLELIGKIGVKNITVFCPQGKRKRLNEILEIDHTVVIGGFSAGYYKSDLKKFESASIFENELAAWVVAYEIIANYESKFSII